MRTYLAVAGGIVINITSLRPSACARHGLDHMTDVQGGKLFFPRFHVGIR